MKQVVFPNRKQYILYSARVLLWIPKSCTLLLSWVRTCYRFSWIHFSTGFNYFWAYNQGFLSIRRSPHTNLCILQCSDQHSEPQETSLQPGCYFCVCVCVWSILHSSVMSLDFTHVLVSSFPFLLFYPSPGGLLQPTVKRFSSWANSLAFGSHCFGLGKDPNCSVFPVLFSAFSHCHTQGCLSILRYCGGSTFVWSQTTELPVLILSEGPWVRAGKYLYTHSET